ncbi:MAG: hypothetical protein LC721_00175 [Actinobacteria bacterium]|nr:hypothetical protein [Actinomycetota bacterium]
MTTLATTQDPTEALAVLAALHGLEALYSVQATNRDGHLVLHVAIQQSDAESWRAAIGGMPRFTETKHTHYSSWRTSAIWLEYGAIVHLLYADY